MANSDDRYEMLRDRELSSLSWVLDMLLANQDTELTQDHSGRKAASRNSRGRCGGPPCPERHGYQSGVSRPSL